MDRVLPSRSDPGASTAVSVSDNSAAPIVALGISTEGVKVPLGLWEGSAENATVATALLSDLVERGLDPEQGMLFVIDGSKALRKAVRDVFGEAPVQRCIRHKERKLCVAIESEISGGDHGPDRRRSRLAVSVGKVPPMAAFQRRSDNSFSMSRRVRSTRPAGCSGPQKWEGPPEAGLPQLRATAKGPPPLAVGVQSIRD